MHKSTASINFISFGFLHMFLGQEDLNSIPECTFSPNERRSFFCVIDDNQLKESPSIVLALREKRTNGPLKHEGLSLGMEFQFAFSLFARHIKTCTKSILGPF